MDVADEHFAPGGVIGAGDHIDQGGLAGAGFAEHGDKLTGPDGDADVMQGGNGPAGVS